MKITIASFFLFCFFLIGACSKNEQCSAGSSVSAAGDKPAPAQPNPNGDSELALLMREMFDESWRMKEEIAAGKKPSSVKKFEAMHTAQATEPEKAASDEYKAFTTSYQQLLENLEQAQPGHYVEAYNNVITSCMNCHRVMCPGPMVRIKQLYVSNK